MIKESRPQKTKAAPGRIKPPAESLANRAYQQIRSEILSGKLTIGDILSRRHLAKELNMSFLPVTEALKRLESDGLVESRPRVGTRVRVPTGQDVRDNTIIREALESQAARLCALHIAPSEKKQLLTRARHLDELYRMCEKDREDSRFLFSVHTYHMQFHEQIARLARCPGLYRAIEKEQVLIFNWLYDIAANRHRQPPKFHSALAQALCSSDPDVADRAMREHVQYGLKGVLESLAQYDSGDNWRLKTRKLRKPRIVAAKRSTRFAAA